MNIIEYFKEQDDAFLGKGCSKKDISDYEKNMSLSFSEEYIMYLEKIGVAACNGHEFTGIGGATRLDVKKVTDNCKELFNVSDDLYVIEETNIDGIIIWQSSQGDVYMTQPGCKCKKICKSFLEYLKEY